MSIRKRNKKWQHLGRERRCLLRRSAGDASGANAAASSQRERTVLSPAGGLALLQLAAACDVVCMVSEVLIDSPSRAWISYWILIDNFAPSPHVRWMQTSLDITFELCSPIQMRLCTWLIAGYVSLSEWVSVCLSAWRESSSLLMCPFWVLKLKVACTIHTPNQDIYNTQSENTRQRCRNRQPETFFACGGLYYFRSGVLKDGLSSRLTAHHYTLFWFCELLDLKDWMPFEMYMVVQEACLKQKQIVSMEHHPIINSHFLVRTECLLCVNYVLFHLALFWCGGLGLSVAV